MVFRKGIYHKYRKDGVKHGRVKFHRCKKCGKKFSDGERIWKKFKTGSFTRVVGYLCDSCYNSLFIDF